MNIIYRKNTLYVYLKENIDRDVLENMEERVNNIMGTYNIDNLVINTGGVNDESIHEFATRYNHTHKSNVIIK